VIHYTLVCGQAHPFDGWFPSSSGFEQQADAGLVECPVCGDTKITRGLMAPAVPRKGNSLPVAQAQSTPPVAVAGEKIPDQVRVVLQRLRAEVETHCDYVGDQFAEEARRIHNGDSDKRAIYGETTPEEAEALAEDGIEVAKIPWVPRADS
jgi:hypothetical protein